MSANVADWVTPLAAAGGCWVGAAGALTGAWLLRVRRGRGSRGDGPLVPPGRPLPALLTGWPGAEDATMTRAAAARSSRPARPGRATIRAPRRHRPAQFVDPYSPLLLDDVAFTRSELIQARSAPTPEH